MAKKLAKTVKKKVAKPAAKAKKPVQKVSKPAAKPAKKKASKPVKPAAKAKPAPKKPAPAPKAAPAKSAPAAKGKTSPAKAPAPAKPEPKKAAPPVKNAEAPKKTAAPAPAPVDKISSAKAPAPPAPAPIDTSKLPKLPKGIIIKRQKGKLAPGEKRIVKTDVITHHIIADKPAETEKKQKPEPAGKFVMEYLLHTPVSLLYDFLTTPNGLAEWFADGVDMKNDIYTFEWDGVKQNAKIVSAKLDSHIRLSWLDKPEGYYFEFKVEQDELTNEVSLIVTDFGDSPDDIATSRHLWETQIHRLMKALGSY